MSTIRWPQFERFLEEVLADPAARAAFHRAQRSQPVRMPAGEYYRSRRRRRTRSRR